VSAPAEKVAAVVVLYRPDRSVLDNVASYADQVGAVFAVDNDEETDPTFMSALCDLPNVTCIANGANLGIATALNIGARAARAAGFAWALTMDQDSTATPGMVGRLMACALGATGHVGLVSPVHRQVDGEPREVPSDCHEVLTAMTSGNVVSLEALEAVGWFMDDLFIDQVDNEVCLRFWREGYRVLEAGDADLVHRVGDVRKHRFPYPAYSSNHSAIRRYYIMRNRLWVGRMYESDHPEFGKFERAQMRKDVVKIVLYEREKARKLAMIWRGWRDYRAGRLGAYGGR
jgi:rhamnosyltransferase